MTRLSNFLILEDEKEIADNVNLDKVVKNWLKLKNWKIKTGPDWPQKILPGKHESKGDSMSRHRFMEKVFSSVARNF